MIDKVTIIVYILIMAHTTKFDENGNCILSDIQKGIVLATSPDWMVEDVFCGDDNDLACIIDQAACNLAKSKGSKQAAKLALDYTPKGFITDTLEELEDYYSRIVQG